jgi:hypothetical protein
MSKTFTVKQVIEAAHATNFLHCDCSTEDVISTVEQYLKTHDEKYQTYLELKEKFELNVDFSKHLFWYQDESGKWISVGKLPIGITISMPLEK